MRHRLTLALAALTLAGCAPAPPAARPDPPTAQPAPTAPSPAPPAPPASPAPAAFDEAAALAGVQAALDRYAQAYNRGDLALLQATVDQRNPPFARLVEERFRLTRESLGGRGLRTELTARSVAPREHGFVLAEVEGGSGLRYGWLFRQEGERWLLSEPTARQIGERYTIESEHFIFRTYPWADDINGRIVELMEQSYVTVTARLGRKPDVRPTVDIRPIFGITPPQSASALAYYRAGNRPRADQMVVFAPNSYAFGGYDPARGWEGELAETLTHELTHFVNNRSFMPVATMRDWMYEGLAEYVAGSARTGEVALAVERDAIIPIVDPAGGVNPQDLDHLYLLERDRSLAYGLSYALVAYIDEELGGLEAFWRLAEEFNRTPGTGVDRYDAALRSALGVSYAEFDAGWRAWLRERY